MGKFLSGIFSVALVMSTVVSPSLAQILKKDNAASTSSAKATVTMKAQAAPAESLKKNAWYYALKPRTAQSPIRSQKASAGKLVNKAVTKSNAEMPTIYGSVIFNDKIDAGLATTGLYELPKNEGATSFLFPAQGANGGGVCINGVYHSVNYFTYFGLLIVSYVSNDMEEGEVLGMSEPSDLSVIGHWAVDPTSDPASPDVYGITFTPSGDSMQLSSLELTNTEVSATAIAPVDGYWNSIAFDNQGQLYGISYTGEEQGSNFIVTNAYLNKIDKTTGAVTPVAEISGTQAPQYMSSSCIDPKSGKMYWNVCPADNHSYMYEVDLATGVAQFLYQITDNDEIMGMFVPDPPSEDGAPAECENIKFNFEGSSLSGNISLTSPSTFFDGTPGSGELMVTVLVNDEQMGCSDVAWGSDVEIPVDLSLTGAGSYTFTIFASNDVGMGPRTKIKDVWVGADTPRPTTATLTYVNGNMEVSWQPVTASVNGGYLDLENLTYTVKDKDGAVVAENLTGTSFSQAVAEPDEIISYFYTVETVCNGLVSAAAKTNVIVLGSVVPPYTPDFLATGLAGWTVTDCNEDGYVWTVMTDGKDAGAVRNRYNSTLAMDDWLITPPLKLEAGKAYEVSFDSKAYGTMFQERLEVKFGKSSAVEDMTEVLLEPTDLVSEEYISFSQMLIPDEDGLYFVGFHGISDKNKLYLYLNNIKIAAAVSALAPGLVSNLTATPDASGANRCTVSFNAPDKTMNDLDLASLTKVEILRDGELVKTFPSPGVGASLSFVDEMEAGGNVTYTVIGHNTDGVGLKATVSVFVGFDIPAAVPSAKITGTEVDGQVTVNWEPVTTDINGLSFPADKVSYIIAASDGSKWVPFAENIKGTSYTYQAVEAGKQEFVQLAVFPSSDAGVGEGAATEMIPVGTPYDGIYESFTGGKLNYIWGSKSINGGNLLICTDQSLADVTSMDGDGGFVTFNSSYADGGADFFSGLVSLGKMVNPGLTFFLYNSINEENPDNRNINEVSVSVREIGTENWVEIMKPTTVDELCDVDNAWNKVTVSLATYAGRNVQICITGITKLFVNTMIDNIRVSSILDNDLHAVSISAPAKVKCGEGYNVSVGVVNDGTLDAPAFSVELYADGNLIATRDVEGLASLASTKVDFNCVMSGLATEPVSVYARVVYSADENEANNQSSSVEVMPVVSKLPGVDNLEGSAINGEVKLTWDEPTLEGGEPEMITDDFEDGDAFAPEYGDWTFVDGDGCPVGGFYGLELPGIISGATPGSFWIWDQESISGGNKTFDAHSGKKYLFSLFRSDNGTVDDWAISPQLTGEAQTISFWAKSYDGQYPESIQVYYSTGGKTVSDFVAIEESIVEGVPGDWTMYTVDLPEGAKYFAIHSFATDSYMLMIDDVTYTPAVLAATLQIAGYNVYRDGVKINSELVYECEYIDNNVVEDTQYSYIVTVVYTEKGESKPSNEVVVLTPSGVDSVLSGEISIKAIDSKVVVSNAEGRDIVVSAANGSVVYRGIGQSKTEIALPGGVYIVKAGNKVVKVIVKG